MLNNQKMLMDFCVYNGYYPAKIISNAEILGMNSNIHTSRSEITLYGDINAVDARSYWQWRIESIPRKSANRKG